MQIQQNDDGSAEKHRSSHCSLLLNELETVHCYEEKVGKRDNDLCSDLCALKLLQEQANRSLVFLAHSN